MAGVLHDMYTSFAGSLVHPVVMLVLVFGWVYVGVLGLRVRNQRKDPSERITLLGGGGAGEPFGLSHSRLAALLLFVTVAGMLFGMGNTYARTGKLFPTSHLFCAFALLACLSANVALSTWLREKSELRTVHAVVGAVIILLLASQLLSGIKLVRALFSIFL